MRPVGIRSVWTGAAVVAALTVVAPLAAHDFWLVPDAFQMAAGSSLVVRTVIGIRFPTSESPVTTDRVADARILGATASADDALKDFAVQGKSLVIQHRPSTAGQRLIAMALAPASRKISGEGLARYLRLEGAADVADYYARDNRLPTDSITMRSVKYAKTLVQVGGDGGRAFSRSAGHALDVTPLADPMSIRAGDTLSFRVTLNGKPLASAHIHAGRAPTDGEAPAPDLSLTAGDDGIVRLPIARAGLWNVRTAFAAPSAAAAGAPPTWDVWWATFVFQSATTSGARSSAASPVTSTPADSSSAVAAAAAFRAALAKGDSVAALALLAPDVVIMEAGGIELLPEYRSHHLPADIAYARAVPGVHMLRSAVVRGDAAWVSSTSVAEGQFNGRAVNSAGAELIVLSRQGAGAPWTIRAIHWSSRRKLP